MANIVVGRRYEVTMKGEPEFGGPMRVTKATARFIEAVFSFKKTDPIDYVVTLRFSYTQKGIKYNPPLAVQAAPAVADKFDAFPSAIVRFKQI